MPPILHKQTLFPGLLRCWIFGGENFEALDFLVGTSTDHESWTSCRGLLGPRLKDASFYFFFFNLHGSCASHATDFNVKIPMSLA